MPRLFADLAFAFGWSHDTIMRLSVRQFYLYIDRLDAVKKDEWHMQLAIVTNPHCKGDDQKALWRLLRRNRVREAKPIRAELEAEAALIRADLEKERLAKEQGNGV